ncbi:DUF5615 family PIN-like protein [Trichothermofontia sichuanensis B231]|uniref:DUF5615 family PIN-like protein n=1 Tax=Trichothermofontia sichuanensis TaxID=3045816 RepID=UPI002245B497|nr:DUF5615 family PIN-like protein [Trichothermofontia sichuanensis B231]
MIRFLADENFNRQIIRGILRQNSQVDIVCAQDVGLSGVDDPSVLAWAAAANRIGFFWDFGVNSISSYK